MRTAVRGRWVSFLVGLCLSAACGSGGNTVGSPGTAGSPGTGGSLGMAGAQGTAGAVGTAGTSGTNPQDGPPAGYPDGHASVPAQGQAEDVSSPTTVVGTGSAGSCTGDAFVAAVAAGG